jgi:hypothetical protein
MAIVSEISWDDMFDGKSVPENPVRKAWREAVDEIAEKAKVALPECNGRVESAVKIVLNGDVELLEGTKAKVASQSNGTTKYFIVNGECTCKDYSKAPSNWCKHRIAAGIAKRAYTLAKQRLDQLDSAQNDITQSTPEQSSPETPVPAQDTTTALALPLPEAPASANVHVMLAGRQVQVTLRDSDEQRLLQRLETWLSRFPVEEPAEPETTTPPPDNWCPIHQCQTKKYSNEKGSWFSHKTANGQWCNGKKGK